MTSRSAAGRSHLWIRVPRAPGQLALTIPASTKSGTFYVIAKADAAGVVAETSETNNTSAKLIKLGPDLVISSLTVPATAGPGTTITVGDTTKNQGGGGAAASTTTFYLSANTSLDGTDVLLANRPVGTLAAGATNVGATTLTIPAATATGTYYLIASADGAGIVAETTETNNANLKSIKIGPDLVVSAVTAPATAGAGQTMTAGDTTTNQGGGGAGASATGFYLSTDSSLDATDVLLGSRPVVALTAGTADTGTVALTIPTSTGTGSFYLIAKADDGGAVPETAETNNTRARLIRMGPDLMIASMTVPATALPGQSITVADTTRNQGGGDAAASTTSFYLSTNTTLDASDVLLAGRSVDPLVAGGTSTESTTVVLSADTVPGRYYLFAKADAGNTVPETQETNNTNFKAIQIGS